MPGLAPAPIIATRVLASLIALLLPSASPSVGLEIRWDTSPACVATEGLEGRVASLTGRDSPPGAQLALGAERRGEEWKISLELEPLGAGAAGLRRSLGGRDCAVLTAAVALVVAVHLDAVAVASAAALVSAPAHATESSSVAKPEVLVPRAAAQPEPAVVLEPTRVVDSSPAPRQRPRALLEVAAAGELGVLPRGAAALELAGGVGWSHASLELGGLVSVGPDGVSEQAPAVGGRFRLYTGLLRGCGVPTQGRLALPLCAGLELGDLRAVGTGLRRPSTVDALWVAAVASARPLWSLRSRLAVGAGLDLVVPLRRHRFATVEAGLVHEVAPVAVRLGIRLALRLP